MLSYTNKPYLALADTTDPTTRGCYGDGLSTALPEQRQRRKAAMQDSLELVSTYSQQESIDFSMVWSKMRQWTDSSTISSLARLVVVVLLLACALEVSLRCIGIRRLSYIDESAQLYDLDIDAKPDFAEAARFEGIIGLVANSLSANTYTATVDTVRCCRHACLQTYK
jgi:hypothetical protein